MTPQERQLIDDLFDRLASLENNPRDADAVRAMRDGLQRAPNALYPLVQTALVQDEALKRAHARIQELEDELGIEPGEPAKQPGFLDNMRDALLGTPHGLGAIGAAGCAGRRARQPVAHHHGAAAGGLPGRRLRRGASGLWSAAGRIGRFVPRHSRGDGCRRGRRRAADEQLPRHVRRPAIMGQSAFGSGQSGTPWGGDASGSDMARDAGLNDIGRGGGDSGNSQHAGLFDANSDDGGSDDDSSDFDVGGDFGGGGDSSDT